MKTALFMALIAAEFAWLYRGIKAYFAANEGERK